MADTGIRTTNLPLAATATELLAHEMIGGAMRSVRVPIQAVAALASASGGAVYADTLAALQQRLAYPEGTGGFVLADPTAANNGIYAKTGASGSGGWARLRDLLTGAPGAPGAQVELRKTTDFIQWRLVGSADWINLVALADIRGPVDPTLDSRIVSLGLTVGGKAAATDLAVEVQARTALAATVDGKAAKTDLSTLASVVGGKAAQTDLLDLLARLLRLNAGLYPFDRPGDTPTAFSAFSAGGDPDALAPLDTGVYPIRPVADGLGVELAASREVWTRRYLALEAGHVGRIRVRYTRTVNPADPSNDSVQILGRWYDAGRNPVGAAAVLQSATLAVGQPPHEYVAFVGGAGVEGVTVVPPAGVVYLRVGVRAYGIEGRTVLTDLSAIDVTDVDDAVLRLLPADSLPGLQAQIDQEVTDRQQAVAALQAVYDAIVAGAPANFNTFLDAYTAVRAASERIDGILAGAPPEFDSFTEALARVVGIEGAATTLKQRVDGVLTGAPDDFNTFLEAALRVVAIETAAAALAGRVTQVEPIKALLAFTTFTPSTLHDLSGWRDVRRDPATRQVWWRVHPTRGIQAGLPLSVPGQRAIPLNAYDLSRHFGVARDAKGRVATRLNGERGSYEMLIPLDVPGMRQREAGRYDLNRAVGVQRDRAGRVAAQMHPTLGYQVGLPLSVPGRRQRRADLYDLSLKAYAERDANGRLLRYALPSDAVPAVAAATVPADQTYVVYAADDGTGTGRTAIYSETRDGGRRLRLSALGATERSPVLTSDGMVTWISDRTNGAPGGGYCSPVAVADEHPVLPLRSILCLGDSMTEQDYPAQLQALLSSCPCYNFGKSGRTSRSAVARQGSVPATYMPVGGTIPASGAVTLTGPSPRYSDLAGPNDAYANAPASTHGTLAGIAGTLAWSGTAATFTRDASGSAVTISTFAPFVADPVTSDTGTSVPNHADMMAIYWFGRNRPEVSTEIVSQMRAAAAFLRSRVRRFVVMPMFNSASEPIGSAGYRTVMAVNAALQAAFPDNYAILNGVDARKYIVNLGQSGNAQDQADYANDVTPTSHRQSGDGLHLVRGDPAKGYGQVAQFLAQFINAKGWL